MDKIDYKDRKFQEVALGTNFLKRILAETDNMYQRRLFLLLIQITQEHVKGKHLDSSFRLPDLHSLVIRFHISQLTKDDGMKHNSQRVTAAIEALMEKKLPFECMENNEHCVGAVNLLYGYKKYPNSGYFVVALSNMVWKALYDFVAGFQKVDIRTCLKLKSFYSIYIYSAIYDQDTFKIGIDKLKEIFKLESKYKNSHDFIKHVIEPAKAELDKKSSRSFDYEIERDDKRRGCPVKNIIFRGKTIESNITRDEIEYKTRMAMRFDGTIQRMIMNKTGCGPNSINNNMKLFSAAQEYMGIDKLYNFIDQKLMPRALRADNSMGYIVAGLKAHLAEVYSYDEATFSEKKYIEGTTVPELPEVVKETVDSLPPESDYPIEKFEFSSLEEEHEADMAWLASNKINPAEYVPASFSEENEEYKEEYEEDYKEAEQPGNEPDAATFEKDLKDRLDELSKKFKNLSE